jgi:hypothetical protein
VRCVSVIVDTSLLSETEPQTHALASLAGRQAGRVRDCTNGPVPTMVADFARSALGGSALDCEAPKVTTVPDAFARRVRDGCRAGVDAVTGRLSAVNPCLLEERTVFIPPVEGIDFRVPLPANHVVHETPDFFACCSLSYQPLQFQLGQDAPAQLRPSGWFRRRIWAWRLTVAVIATRLLGDLINAVTGHFAEAAVGVAVAGGLILYLFRADVRAAFDVKD